MVLEVKSPAMMIVRFGKERCHVVTIEENGGLPDFRFSYLSILPTSGADIGQLAGQMIRLAQVLNCPVTCYFNDTMLEAYPTGDDEASVVHRWEVRRKQD
jgi:hypothetical protein